MPVTELQEYEVMYSANRFPPRVWLKNGGRFIVQLVFNPNGSALPEGHGKQPELPPRRLANGA